MSQPSINYMSVEITKKLVGVHPDGKNIIVPDETIRSVAVSMFENNYMSVDVLQEMTVNYISNSIRAEFQTIQKNNELSIWITNYDVSSGMKKFSDIKLNNKSRRNNMQWHY